MLRARSSRRVSKKVPAASPTLPSPTLPSPTALYVGRLVGTMAEGRVLVQVAGGTESFSASVDGASDPATLARAQQEGSAVVVMAGADGLHVVGLLQSFSPPARQEISASDQVVLRSGAASLTLTAAGKVLLRGAYVSSWSNGVNRIVGRSVRLD